MMKDIWCIPVNMPQIERMTFKTTATLNEKLSVVA